jgi:hypothetical protein
MIKLTSSEYISADQRKRTVTVYRVGSEFERTRADLVVFIENSDTNVLNLPSAAYQYRQLHRDLHSKTELIILVAAS